MEELSGTGSRGTSRDPCRAGAGTQSGPRRQPHLSNHTQTLLIALLRDARSTARRADRPSRAGGAPAGPVTTVSEDTSSNDPNPGRRSAPRGRWRDRLGLVRAPRRRPVARPIRASLVLSGGPRPRRNGGDVHRGRLWPGGERARRCSTAVARRIRADPRRSIQRQRAATASPARFRPSERHPEHGGNEPCRRWKQRPPRPRSSTA